MVAKENMLERTIIIHRLSSKMMKRNISVNSVFLKHYELGRLQKKKGDRYVQKSVDIQLAIDMLSKAFKDQYDVAILVSGDADFVRVVEIVKDLGKHVELAFVTKQKCYHLTSVVDKTIEIDAELLVDCWL